MLGIRDRLQVLVQFYSHASEVKMSLSDAKALYTLLAKDKEELAELHRMLLRGVATSASDAIFTLSVARSVFLDYFCAAAMQWALCGANALECFQSYYTRLLEQEQGNHLAEEDIQFSPETESGADGDDSPASTATSPSAAPRQELIRSGVAALWRLALALPAGQHPSSRHGATAEGVRAGARAGAGLQLRDGPGHQRPHPPPSPACTCRF